MEFEPLTIGGAYVVKSIRHDDDRGYFARAWCQREFESAGQTVSFVQTSLSFNHKAGTVRGMHYQLEPYSEVKLVRCIRGRMLDVVLDLRPESPTYREHISVELDSDGRRAVLVPKGCAHGFMTLEDDTEVLYMISEFYNPDASAGVRWNDPAFSIKWPREISTIATRDAEYPDYEVQG